MHCTQHGWQMLNENLGYCLWPLPSAAWLCLLCGHSAIWSFPWSSQSQFGVFAGSQMSQATCCFRSLFLFAFYN